MKPSVIIAGILGFFAGVAAYHAYNSETKKTWQDSWKNSSVPLQEDLDLQVEKSAE